MNPACDSSAEEMKMAFQERRSRPQRTMAMMVNIGIELIASQGRYAAAQFMEDAGVPLKVIARVISEPDLRRSADPA